MERRPPSPALRSVLVLALVALLGLAAPVGGALAAKPAKQPSRSKARTFEACHRGCPYRTVQAAVDAAGTYAFKHRGGKVTVAVRPGRYLEGVVVDGARPRKDFDGMTIEGTVGDRKRTVLEGGAGPGGAEDGIEAVGVDGLVLKNLWARGFGSSGFLVHASNEGGERCEGFTMSNLLASGNRAYGLAAEGCTGGRMIESAAYRQGGAGFFVGETPCDSPAWNVYEGTPCQADPRPTLLRDDESHENLLGFSGTNSKYVQVLESAFFDNATGIAVASPPGVSGGPNGWNAIERNDVFWNNYNPFLAGSAFSPAAGGLGELAGRTLNYPTGVGIVVHGGDRDIVRDNRVFGNYKWGIATFSGPGGALFGSEADEAKSVNNEIVENVLGRDGADPNGEYDFWNDATGGGNCWGANSPGSTFAPGNGKVPQGQVYPVCPQAPVEYATAKSANLTAGLQSGTVLGTGGPSTILGYAGTDPPQDQQCSWVRRIGAHPAFQRFEPVELTPAPGEVTCGRS